MQVEPDVVRAVKELQRLRRSARSLRNEALYQHDRSWRLRMESMRHLMRTRELEESRRRTPSNP
ncbi:MAG TPA: hypothetical protein VFN99_08245 [Gaiella sp.]|nr:hypothetical protein [Gaiella sp.]